MSKEVSPFLISMAGDGQELADENGFAATIILRVVEEMEGKPHRATVSAEFGL